MTGMGCRLTWKVTAFAVRKRPQNELYDPARPLPLLSLVFVKCKDPVIREIIKYIHLAMRWDKYVDSDSSVNYAVCTFF